jgi:hypothetical protein
VFELCSTIEATDQSRLFRFVEFEIGGKIQIVVNDFKGNSMPGRRP